MKILLFSDIHIHTHKHSYKRLQHCLDTLKWVFNTARERQIPNVVFLGDLFQDREKIHVPAYQHTFEAIRNSIDNTGHGSWFNLYLLLGNHDMWYADKTDISSVYPLGALEGVTIISHPTTLNIGGFNIDFLPFTTNPIEDINSFENPSRVLCGHIALDGANLRFNVRADVSVEHDGDMVKVDQGKFSKWDRVFLGHYHAAQKIDHVEYVGSPLQLNFAEADQRKHIIILDTETLETEYVENTFSPKHLVLKMEELDKYDLNNSFLKIEKQDATSDELIDIRKTLVEEHNLLSIEFAPVKKENDVGIQEVQASLTRNPLILLEKYIKAKGADGLEETILREMGEKFIERRANA